MHRRASSARSLAEAQTPNAGQGCGGWVASACGGVDCGESSSRVEAGREPTSPGSDTDEVGTHTGRTFGSPGKDGEADGNGNGDGDGSAGPVSDTNVSANTVPSERGRNRPQPARCPMAEVEWRCGRRVRTTDRTTEQDDRH